MNDKPEQSDAATGHAAGTCRRLPCRPCAQKAERALVLELARVDAATADRLGL